MMKIGTSGFRGIIADEFTKENVTKIIQCLCNIIDREKAKREVVVGYDNRFMSEVFAKWICEVLAGNNVKAYITNTSVPSPLVSYATKYLKNDFGIMVTASHNPYFYNGLKLYEKEGKEVDNRLEGILNSEPITITNVNIISYEQGKENGLIEEVSLTKPYIDNIISLIKFKEKFDTKVIFNVMNGSSLVAVEQLKKQLKLKNLDIVNTHRDALFNLDGPIPNEDKLQDYRKHALENKYDFAFATDGDGDRMAVFDEKGKFYNGNEINTLLYYFMIKEKGLSGPFIKNYSFSTIIDKLAKKLGQNVVETKIGFKYISEALIENNALIGAENSGGEIKNHVYVKDGLVIFALLLEIVEYYKLPLSQIFNNLKKEAGYTMEYVENSFTVDNKQKIIDYLTTKQPKFSKKVVEKGDLDGYKFKFEDGTWVHIRFSGNENLIRVVVEQNSKKELEDMLEEAKQIIADIQK
ncbi:MAG: hypothetical protein IKI95_02440 [Clostridia bacterium]|nr:hypothetical protein [Clostridia bacterium]